MAYLDRALDHAPYGRSSTLRHVVGGSNGGGFEWTADAGAAGLVGITALEHDGDGLVTRITSVLTHGRARIRPQSGPSRRLLRHVVDSAALGPPSRGKRRRRWVLFLSAVFARRRWSGLFWTSTVGSASPHRDSEDPVPGRRDERSASSTAPRAAREFLRDTLHTQDLDGLGHVSELLTTELVANVVDHVGCAVTVRAYAKPELVRGSRWTMPAPMHPPCNGRIRRRRGGTGCSSSTDWRPDGASSRERQARPSGSNSTPRQQQKKYTEVRAGDGGASVCTPIVRPRSSHRAA